MARRPVVYGPRFFDETKPTEISWLGKKSKRPTKERQLREGHAAGQGTEAEEVAVMRWVPEEAGEAPQQPAARSPVALREQVRRLKDCWTSRYFKGCVVSPNDACLAGGHGGGWFGGGSGGGAGGGFFGGRGGKSGVKGKEFAEADIRQREARINADKLHVMSPEDELDSEDEAMIEALSGRTAITMPMGIFRKEHKEQGVVVATTAELEAAEKATGEEEEESLFVDGEGSGTIPPVDQPEEGIWNTDGKAFLIKKEPGTEDPMDLDAEIKPAPTGEEEEEEEAKEIKRPIPPASVKKELPKDPEERAIQSDMDLLASELGAATVTDEAGVSHTEGPASKDGRLYLFQFPPLLPPLKEIAQPVFKVKEEAKDINLMDAPSASDPTPVDLTNGSGDDDKGQEEEQLEADGFRSQFLSRGGMVGKMTVRKSGKVELEWGGMALEISPAAGMSFLTTAVIVEENDEKTQHGVAGGECVGMGKIMGRFVLAPTWGEEEDWDVAPEELVAA